MSSKKIIGYSLFILFLISFAINGFAQQIENNDQYQKNKSVGDWSEFFPEIPNCVREISLISKYQSQYTQQATYTTIDKPIAEKIFDADKQYENQTATLLMRFDLFPNLQNQCGYIRIQKGTPPKPRIKVIPYGGEPKIKQIRIKGYKANIVRYGCDYLPCDLDYFENIEVYFDKNRVVKFHIRKDIAKARELAEQIDYEKLKQVIDKFRKK
jgi:hypothetical protein